MAIVIALVHRPCQHAAWRLTVGVIPIHGCFEKQGHRSDPTGQRYRARFGGHDVSPDSGVLMWKVSDDEAGNQILSIFVRNKVSANGALRRNHFFDVRDGDFQRGIDRAVLKKWIKLHHRDRYCYILTEEGFAAGRQVGERIIPKIDRGA